jgi:predicted alpha-1,2-mannosidase
MKRAFPLFLALNCLVPILCECDSQQMKKNIDYVDPFICTLGDHGHLFPGAVVPHGMVKLGPDTYPSSLTGDGDWAHSGYNYADTKIRGFSHIRRESSGGTAIYDRSWLVSVFPSVGVPDIATDKLVASIDKTSEQASPGLYHVNLSDAGIRAALTADTHAGMHRYTFPRTNDAHISINPGSQPYTVSSTIAIIDSSEFSGSLQGQGFVYFWGQSSKPFHSFATWDTTLYPGIRTCEGKRIGAILDFQTSEGESIYLKIGFSAISVEQAHLNLQAEIPDWNFDAVVQKARKSWSAVLDLIDVKGEEEYKKIFYTALYHSFQQPTRITDVNGKYPGYDKEIHEAKDFVYYDNYGFWDDYRTKYPLMSLINPKTFKDVTRSILEIYRQSSNYWFYSNKEHTAHKGGFVVCGPDGYQPFITLRHEHMLTAVLDAYAKGLIKDSMQEAFTGMRKEALVQMPEEYEEIGYIPGRPDQTFEYSYDNWCVAQMARMAGEESDYQRFMKRASYYRNTWDYSIGFLRARAADGTWLDFPESPTINREKYMYEGTPWQWRWFVPHDVPGMIDMMGGKEKFVQDLEYFFANNLYQAGNQPDVQAPFLFNYADAAWLTQKWVRTILVEPMTQLYASHGFFDKPIYDRIFKATPDGYLLMMDDDYGCMAAWFVMSAMGLYQVCPGLPVYQLTAPIFDEVTIKLDPDFYAGRTFSIAAENLSKENIYIQSASLNGQPYDKCSITHQEIVKGGKLIFEMGPAPNKNWGKTF